MDNVAIAAKEASSVDMDLSKALVAIKENPRLTQCYVDVLSSLYSDNEHRFSTIERDMFVSLKVLYDTIFEKAVTNNTDGMLEYKDYLGLLKIVKDLYESLNRSLQTARVKSRDEATHLDGLKKITIEKKDSITEIEVKERDIIDIE